MRASIWNMSDFDFGGPDFAIFLTDFPLRLMWRQKCEKSHSKSFSSDQYRKRKSLNIAPLFMKPIFRFWKCLHTYCSSKWICLLRPGSCEVNVKMAINDYHSVRPRKVQKGQSESVSSDHYRKRKSWNLGPLFMKPILRFWKCLPTYCSSEWIWLLRGGSCKINVKMTSHD